MGEFLYRHLLAEEINRELFRSFQRYQVVTNCLRRRMGYSSSSFYRRLDGRELYIFNSMLAADGFNRRTGLWRIFRGKTERVCVSGIKLFWV